MKKFFILSFLLLMSCSKNILEDIETDSIVLEGKSNSYSIQDQPSLRFAGDGKWDVLGFGYDITGAYLHPKSVKRPILNVDLLEQTGRLIYDATGYGYERYIYGASAMDYISELTKEEDFKIKTGYLAVFSQTITQNRFIKYKYASSSKNSFASCDKVKNIKKIFLNMDISQQSNYLHPVFVSDLQTLSPDRIVELYGTHVLTDFNIGGRLNLIYKSSIYSTSDDMTKRTIIKSGFNAVIEGVNIAPDGSVSQEMIETYKNENTMRELYVEYYGGSGTGSAYNLETGVPTINVAAWESSVNTSNAALVDVNWQETYPIYDFISDPVKKAEIKAAVERYVESKKMTMTYLTPVFERTIKHKDGELKDITCFTNHCGGANPNSRLIGWCFWRQQTGTSLLYRYYRMYEMNACAFNYTYNVQNSGSYYSLHDLGNPWINYHILEMMGFVGYYDFDPGNTVRVILNDEPNISGMIKIYLIKP